MDWTKKAIDGWIEYYYLLRDYELNPFEFRSTLRGKKFIHGRLPSDSPVDELFDMNWEFDKAIKSLGELGSQVFKLRYLGIMTKKDSGDELRVLCGGRLEQVIRRKSEPQKVTLKLKEINKMLDYPADEIRESWRNCKQRLTKYLLEGEK